MCMHARKRTVCLLLFVLSRFIVYWVSLAPDYAVVYLVYAAVSMHSLIEFIKKHHAFCLNSQALITTPFLFILLNLSIYAVS